MTRLGFAGAEIESRTPSPDRSATATRSTSVFRSGSASWKCDSGAGNNSSTMQIASGSGAFLAIVVVASKTYYVRAYMRFDAAPGNDVVVLTLPGNADGIGVKMTTAAKLRLWNFAAGTQIGSDSSALLTDGSTWYRIEGTITTNGSTQITNTELRLDGTTVASASGLTVPVVANNFQIGWCTPPGANKVCYVDDVAVNDSAGATNNTWCGSGNVLLLKPISDSAVGASWTDDAGSGSSIWDAVANTPPQGIADTTGSTGLHQIRNAGSNTASYDANLTSYTTAGIGASDTINAVLPMIVTGAPVSTGAKVGSVGIASNPAIANIALTGNSGQFWTGSAAGTYPTGWKWSAGTLTEAPSVTLANSPVARVTITSGTASRVAMVCAMFMYVEYTPADVATFVPRNPAINHTATALLARIWRRRPDWLLRPLPSLRFPLTAIQGKD